MSSATVAIIECHDEELELTSAQLLKRQQRQQPMLVSCAHASLQSTMVKQKPSQEGIEEDLIGSLDQAMQQSRSLARCIITGEAVRVNKRLIAEHHHRDKQGQNKRLKITIKQPEGTTELALTSSSRSEISALQEVPRQEGGQQVAAQNQVLTKSDDVTPSLLYQQAARSCRMIRLLQKLEGIQRQLLDDIMAAADDADLRKP